MYYMLRNNVRMCVCVKHTYVTMYVHVRVFVSVFLYMENFLNYYYYLLLPNYQTTYYFPNLLFPKLLTKPLLECATYTIHLRNNVIMYVCVCVCVKHTYVTMYVHVRVFVSVFFVYTYCENTQ